MLENIYLSASILVGAAQVADAIVLFRAGGACRKAQAYFAVFEYIWAGVSIALFRYVEPPWLPLSFVAYMAVGLILSLFVSYRTKAKPQPNSPTLIVPLWFVVAGGLFGLFFSAASLYAYVSA